MISNNAVIIPAINSATTTDIQMPSIPQSKGKTITNRIWKTSVRKKEIKAETTPLPSAVKKDEP